MEDADDKAVSTLYIMLGLEGRRQLIQRFPHVQLSELHFHELWDYLDQDFLVERNITVERVKILSRRKRPPETLEQCHAALTGLAAKCRLGNLEDELIRDVFISNIEHLELQRRFCIKMLSPVDLLREIQAYERGVGDQQTLAKCPMGTATHSSDHLLQTSKAPPTTAVTPKAEPVWAHTTPSWFRARRQPAHSSRPPLYQPL